MGIVAFSERFRARVVGGSHDAFIRRIGERSFDE